MSDYLKRSLFTNFQKLTAYQIIYFLFKDTSIHLFTLICSQRTQNSGPRCKLTAYFIDIRKQLQKQIFLIFTL